MHDNTRTIMGLGIKSKFLAALALFCVTPFGVAREPWKSEYSKYKIEKPGKARIGQIYRADPEKFHVTQFTLGMDEVHERADKLVEKSKHELRRYLKTKIAKAVIGPGGEIWIVDGHHVSAAMIEAERGDVLIKIVRKWSRLNIYEFLDRMKKEGFVYLYDEHGHGPLDPLFLPRNLAEMHDDPARTFAWRVRESGGYAEVKKIPYAEFQWAQYFRQHLSDKEMRQKSKAAIAKGIALARAPEAKGLPGYRGEHGFCEAWLK
jgi:hypothetical protein